MDSPPSGREAYSAYMVRLWQAGSRGGLPVWRASLEDPHSGERLIFGGLAELFMFLTQLTESLLPSVPPTSPEGADWTEALPASEADGI